MKHSLHSVGMYALDNCKKSRRVVGLVFRLYLSFEKVVRLIDKVEVKTALNKELHPIFLTRALVIYM